MIDLIEQAYSENDDDAATKLEALAVKKPASVAQHYCFVVRPNNEIVITPAILFEREGRLCDQYMPDVMVILGEDFYELASSYFEYSDNTKTQQELTKILLSKGFIYNQEFADFVNLEK